MWARNGFGIWLLVSATVFAADNTMMTLPPPQTTGGMPLLEALAEHVILHANLLHVPWNHLLFICD